MKKTTFTLATLIACIVVTTLFEPLSAFAEGPTTQQAAVPVAHFAVSGYSVQGNTVLAQADIDQVLKPYVGPAQDFASIQQAMDALQSAYKKRGYALLRVVLPEQELKNGVVILKVVETRIAKIRSSGNQYFVDGNIKNSVPALNEGAMPDMTAVSNQLKLANENPAKKTSLVLHSGDNPGQIDAELQVVDQNPWSGAIRLDNTGDELTGRNRMTAMLQDANVGGWDNVLSLQYTTSTANPDEVSVFSAGYHIPLYALADSIDVFASHSNVKASSVTAGVFDMDINGSGEVAGVRYNHNLFRAGDYNATLTGGLDYKLFNDDVTLSGAPIGSKVAVHPLSLTYVGSWLNSANNLSANVSVLHNLSGGSDSSASDFTAARSGATAHYSLFRYGLTYLRTLPDDWQAKLDVNGQLSTDALIPGEQFGAGGVDSVRGFFAREIAGDKGRTASLELITPDLGFSIGASRLLAFYDSGYVSNNISLPGEITRQSIGSTGIGVRFSHGRNWLIEGDIAHVLDGATSQEQGTNRADFKVVYSF